VLQETFQVSMVALLHTEDDIFNHTTEVRKILHNFLLNIVILYALLLLFDN